MQRAVAVSHRILPAIDRPAAASRNRLGFGLFILLTFVLFVRPSELIPALAGLPIYEVLILICLLVCSSTVLWQCTLASLRNRPATICMMGLLLAVMLSSLRHGDLWRMRTGGSDFAKLLIYYLLLVGVVDSPSRWRTFMLVLAGLITLIALLALMEYYGLINIASMSVLVDAYADSDGGSILRLRGSGIFNDPNDFSLILATGILIAMHFLLNGRGVHRKPIWMIPIVICGSAFALTRSRGGMLGLGAGLLTLLILRFGWRKALPILLVAAPIILVFFAGRQTNIDLDNPDDTAQGRIHIWRDGLDLMKQSPVFGIGYGMLAEDEGLVAHNSYVHSFVEMGLIGGTLFAGLVYVLVVSARRASSLRSPVLSGIKDWGPGILAIIVSYFTGLFSLTRCYASATYVIVGLAAAYSFIVERRARVILLPVTRRLCVRILVVGLVTIVGLDVFVRLFVR